MSTQKEDNKKKKNFLKKQSEKMRNFVHFVPVFIKVYSDQ